MRSKRLKAVELLDKVQVFSHDSFPHTPAFACFLGLIFGHHISCILCISDIELSMVGCLKMPRHFITSLLDHGVFLCLKSPLLSYLPGNLPFILLLKISLIISSAFRTELITLSAPSVLRIYSWCCQYWYYLFMDVLSSRWLKTRWGQGQCIIHQLHLNQPDTPIHTYLRNHLDRGVHKTNSALFVSLCFFISKIRIWRLQYLGVEWTDFSIF